MNLNELHTRFARALSAVGARRPGHALFEMLVARYSQPHRHYHTLAHIDVCLGWLDWYRGSAQQPERVEIALWFHDAVYDPRASDNERRSARLAREELAELGVPNETIIIIENHIEATRHHRGGNADTRLLSDLDLTILGAPSAAFARFERQIRAEYTYVAPALFALGRSHVLRSFLARPEIYQTPALGEVLEARARFNLERRIDELSDDQELG